MSEHTKSQSCTKAGRKVSLPVLAEAKAKPHSRMGRWRAAVLITVHLLIMAHILQWVVTGSTVSPVEPSESMQTLELGDINAGFIFFVAAILSTLIFGRYFCGWGCHVVALQDLCSWLMNKLGVRPKPFRSRLLVWAPLGFGLYMFVWPTFKRVVLFPAIEAVGLKSPIWLREVADFHGFASEIIVTDFWATFPPWYVAIPFFALIGFAAVYFLGSKGFCTYGCPYGGIFGVVDKVSPGRIVVNDNCHGCGHCTAVCTSNVRVHEEIRDFGMVMDPGCMKCMDCVSACPNDALSFAFTTPAKFRKPRDDEAKKRQKKIKSNAKRFDLTWSEEIVLAIVFVAMFLAYRGMLNLVPMLMSAGMAGIGTYLVWKGWSLLTKPNVRVQSLVLKSKGRIRAAGVISIPFVLLVAGSAIWSGSIASLRFSARMAHERIDVPISVVLRPEYEPTPETARLADRGMNRYAASERYGWELNAEQNREVAFLSLVSGEREQAERFLERIMQDGKPSEDLVRQYLSLITARGANEQEQFDAISTSYEKQPELAGLLPEIAMRQIRLSGGSTESADDFWDRVIADQPGDARILLQAAEYDLATGQTDRAIERLPDLDGPLDLDTGIVGVRVLLKMGRREDAVALLQRLSAEKESKRVAAARVLSSLWLAVGEPDQAQALLEVAVSHDPASAGAHESLGQFWISRGDSKQAADSFEEAVELAWQDPWTLLSLGESITIAGLQARNAQIRDIGLGALARAAELRPDSALILRDLGMARLSSGQLEQGFQNLEQAAEMAPENPAIQQDYQTARRRTDPN